MRYLVLLASLLVLAGCGTSSASVNPTAGPVPAPTQFTASAARFHNAPPMTIHRNHHYTAVVVTTDGTFDIELLPKAAPIAVNSFVFLARHRYFDNIIFHRIVPDYIIQTGDPTGTGYGGPGYGFANERVSQPYTLGTVAMAHSDKPNSNGSQFFIVTVPRIALSPDYTIFGKVSRGLAVVEKIGRTPVTTNPGTGALDMPLVTVTMKSVRIKETP